ncbi:PfkB family carbohydrate kinase [Pauljensenia sp. UMB0018B]|uniref:ADP-ribosylglycohydrolase n=1 Tax=Schaalia odontolytica TaxID=1660 RepID=A0A2I1HY77_9ACTO|nr:PfkB family carbohydrate kinase [Schaalia odontolytica]MDK7340361.1 PfkB family carbohydrate kinase [Pauljensenia sp. UMB0018B]PKY63831.1 ADP-ribosylglycohydrolase [Schaalia odontolytica]
MDPRFSRAYGALAGLALGDALGMPTQAMSPEQIRAVYGTITGLVDGDASQPYAPGMPAGSVTDDTEQALLVASLLVRGRGTSSGRVALDAGEFAHALLAWEDSMIERGSLDLLGPSTKAALEGVRAGEDPLTVGGAGTTNGAAMRVTPIGIAMSTADPEAFADAVWSSCQVTHATRQGFQSAALVAAAVSMGIDAARSTTPDLRGLLWKALSYVDSLPERGAWTPDPDVIAATRRAMQLVANPASSSLECLVEQVGTSVASAQAIPMAFALLARDPSPQALLDAANIGGDTDTIGAIAGAILGAALGFEVFVGRGLAQVELASRLDLPSVALELLELRAAHEPAADAPTSPETEGASEADVPEVPAPASSSDPGAGRVVLMGQILVDHVLAGAAPVYGGGSDWGNDEGLHVSAGFSVLAAARRMGAEAVSLSPIGTGPHASMIEAALAREGIVDAGPRVTDCDNAYRTALVSRNGTCTIIATKGAETMAPENAWADVVRTMKPGDVLFIDGSLMEHPSNKVAADNALRVLPEGVRVVLDVSPVVGIPDGLPSNTIISMNYDESQDLWKRIPDEERKFPSWLPADKAATALAARLGHHVLVRKDESGAYFAPADGAADLSTFHIPTPSVRTVDTNGAGDAHSGVLAACLAQDVALKRALVLANCAGALASTVPGPASCPTRSQIEAAADALSESED